MKNELLINSSPAKYFTRVFNSFLFFSAFLLFACSSCKEEQIDFNNNNCKVASAFVSKLGFNNARSYFSTSDKRTMGLILIEGTENRNTAGGIVKQYQDSSWTKAGWLAPIQIDNAGNVFTGPAPFINVLHNSSADQNTLYKVDAQSGKMEAFVKLPVTNEQPGSQNPFGIIGLAYLCETGSMYVSSVLGSDRQHERGVIYQVDAASGKIMDQLTGIDALGLGICYTTGQCKLYFGKARSSEVYSIKLDKKGGFMNAPAAEFSLENLGQRGDDKVRKIKQDNDGSLVVYGMAFNFNLVPASEKQENVYRFRYDEEDRKWKRSLL